MNLLLKCNDVSETRRFYADIMKFTTWDSAEGTVSAQLSDGTLIFSPADNLGKKPNMSGTVYFFIDDVESYFEMVRDRADVQWPLQDMSYGTREFGIRDCNGYYLAFAQA